MAFAIGTVVAANAPYRLVAHANSEFAIGTEQISPGELLSARLFEKWTLQRICGLRCFTPCLPSPRALTNYLYGNNVVAAFRVVGERAR